MCVAFYQVRMDGSSYTKVAQGPIHEYAEGVR